MVEGFGEVEQQLAEVLIKEGFAKGRARRGRVGGIGRHKIGYLKGWK